MTERVITTLDQVTAEWLTGVLARDGALAGLSVAICVYVAIEYCRGGINHEWTDAWLPMLQQALTACDDLNCRELWA